MEGTLDLGHGTGRNVIRARITPQQIRLVENLHELHSDESANGVVVFLSGHLLVDKIGLGFVQELGPDFFCDAGSQETARAAGSETLGNGGQSLPSIGRGDKHVLF